MGQDRVLQEQLVAALVRGGGFLVERAGRDPDVTVTDYKTVDTLVGGGGKIGERVPVDRAVLIKVVRRVLRCVDAVVAVVDVKVVGEDVIELVVIDSPCAEVPNGDVAVLRLRATDCLDAVHSARGRAGGCASCSVRRE